MSPQNVFSHINGPVVFFVWNPYEDWSVRYVSDNVQCFGYRSADFINGAVKYSDLIHPDDLLRVKEGNKRLLQEGGQSFEQEYRVKNQTGEYCWVVDRSVLIDLHGDEPCWIHGYIVDVTEQKASGLNNYAAEDIYKLLFERSKAVQLIIDFDTRFIIDANAAALAYYGYSLGELKNLKITDINTLSADRFQIEVENAKRDKKSFFDFQHQLKNGEIRDVAVLCGSFRSKGKEFLHSIVNDVTAQKKAERELQQSEAMLRSFISTTTDGFITLDRSLFITDTNQAFCKMLGYSGGRLLGRSIYSLLSFPDTRLINTLSATLHSNNNWSLGAALKRKGGGVVYVQFSGGTIVDGSGVFAFITDISVQKKSEMALKKLSLAVEHAGSSIMITNKQGVVEYVNPSFCQTTGYESSEVIGKTPSLISTGHTPSQTHRDLWETILSGDDWRGETYNRTKTGECYWSFMSISSICDEYGEITHFVSVSEDMTEQKEVQHKLEQLALYDPLTGLANRRLFYDRLAQARAVCLRSSASVLTLIMLDLDKFKLINDTLGHDAGDELLKTISKRLELCVRKTDTVARIGGDEFTIIIQSANGRECIKKIANQILQSIRAPVLIANQHVEVTCSLGISLFSLERGDSGDVIKNADLALYKAKKEGGDNYQVFLNEFECDGVGSGD
ncbi:PAS domain S-box protein [Neptunomonas sp.]|uniref:sensor domain-containing protein n=1 Tax=Neptunomonas sp. TaxID=1971898 RepID=UPI0025F45C7D|nr:PAS domain S-box protein [Neptunomonas sp.]